MLSNVTLADLVAEDHDLLIERFADASRRAAKMAGIDRVELIDSMPFFLDDLVVALASGEPVADADSAAASHGVERLSLGFRIDRVVREYGILAELVLARAAERGLSPSPAELQMLLHTTGEGAAVSAAEFMRRREADLLHRESEHAAFLAHELRNSLGSARFAFDLLRRRDFADAGALAHLVDGGLRQASAHIDDALAGARARGGVISPVRLFPRTMLEEVAAEMRPQAEARQIQLVVVGPGDLTAHADARLMRSAIGNLATNAVKFSQPGGSVTLRASTEAAYLVIEVADACGGLDEGKAEEMFRPFVQTSNERSGFGLGLAIARECAEAQGGSLTVRNVPDHGCVFSLKVPLQP